MKTLRQFLKHFIRAGIGLKVRNSELLPARAYFFYRPQRLRILQTVGRLEVAEKQTIPLAGPLGSLLRYISLETS